MLHDDCIGSTMTHLPLLYENICAWGRKTFMIITLTGMNMYVFATDDILKHALLEENSYISIINSSLAFLDLICTSSNYRKTSSIGRTKSQN